MNPFIAAILGMASTYLQSPSGQEKLVSLLPTVMGTIKGFFDKIEQAKTAGANAERQKIELAQHITDLVVTAAAKAEADHKAHPDDDSGFDPGIFRD